MNTVERDSTYLHVQTHEAELFSGIHMNNIAEWMSIRKPHIEGVCFVVWSATMQGKAYKIYLPFTQQVDSYCTMETIKLNVALAIGDLTNQMRNNMAIH